RRAAPRPTGWPRFPRPTLLRAGQPELRRITARPARTCHPSSSLQYFVAYPHPIGATTVDQLPCGHVASLLGHYGGCPAGSSSRLLSLVLTPGASSGFLRWPRTFASFVRPRAHRLFTVPAATPSISATSLTEYLSTSTSMIGIRWSSGSWSSARYTTRLVSRSSISSRATAGSPGPSSASGTVGLACLRRIRSRHALTTIRCSQVLTADSARNFEAARKADMN